jgi:AmmeMemoRadiSam system protein B
MIRKPVVAGMFYPFDKNYLERMLSKLFDNTKSGSLKPAKSFVIMGPNHNLIGPEFSVMGSGRWETPLGSVPVDSELAKELKKCEILEEDDLAHAREHSIEVQLPFLQYRFHDFSFVPISIANTDYSEEFLQKCISLGNHIANVIKNKPVCIVASSDFSHYLPAKTADIKDSKAVERIMEFDAEGLFRILEEMDASVCGYAPIALAMQISKQLGIKKAKVINRTNSGDTTGDYSSVVSYYAIGFG